MGDDIAFELTIVLTASLAQQLWISAMTNFFEDQPVRYELYGGYDLPLPNDPLFSDGTMFWCETASDMLLLRAHEQACAHASPFCGTWRRRTWP